MDAKKIIPINQIQPRLRRIGKIRLGQKVSGTNREGKAYTRPDKLETFRFTSADQSALAQIALMYGGTVRPWDDEPGQFELVCESNEIYVELLPMPYQQRYEFYKASGLVRHCDGQMCERRSGEEWVSEPCHCHDLKDPKLQCNFVLRLDLKLAGVPVMGIFTMETGSRNASQEMPTQIDYLLASSDGRPALCILALEYRETKVEGQPPKQYFVPTLRAKPGMADEVSRLGGKSLGSVLAGEYTKYLSLGGGAPALEASASHQASQPAEPREVSPEDAELMAKLSELGLAGPEHRSDFDAFKACCKELGKPWKQVLRLAIESGFKSFVMFIEYAAKAEVSE